MSSQSDGVYGSERLTYSDGTEALIWWHQDQLIVSAGDDQLLNVLMSKRDLIIFVTWALRHDIRSAVMVYRSGELFC